MVGLHFLGPNAGEVIQGFTTAMRWEGQGWGPLPLGGRGRGGDHCHEVGGAGVGATAMRWEGQGRGPLP